MIVLSESDTFGGLLLLLQRATHATLETIGAELSGLSMSNSEINVLANLADGDARTVSQLATAIGSRPSTMTGVLDRLEQRGLIGRTASSEDRRAVSIALTAGGRDIAAHIHEVFSRVEHTTLAGLEPETIAALRLGLAAFTEIGHE